MSTPKKLIQADTLGQGWTAALYDDGSMMLANRAKGLAHHLSPAECARLREIMDEHSPVAFA